MPKLKPDYVDTTDKSSIDYTDTSLYQRSTTHSDFYAVDYTDTDAYGGGEEYSFTPNWRKWHGYYRNISSFGATIDKLAGWAVGRGFKAGIITKFRLLKLKGIGKDDFNSILENQTRVCLFNGDSFAEIIKDKAKRLINLKPLNPGTMSTIQGSDGMIKKYKQHARNKNLKTITYQPEKILHLMWNRVADECHGIPFAERVEQVLKAKQEAFLQTKVLMRRHVQPVQIFHLGTDDDLEVARLKAKVDKAYRDTENIYTMTGTIDKVEQVSTPQYSTIDPLPWLKYLQRDYTTSTGVPEVIMGWGEETTEASSKVIYAAFEQTIRRIQRFLEDQLKLQLGIKIELEFPISLEQDLQRDQKKDGPLKMSKPSDLDPAKKTK